MKIFKNCKTCKDYYVKIQDVIDYFKKCYSENIQIDNNKCEYILFKIVNLLELMMKIQRVSLRLIQDSINKVKDNEKKHEIKKLKDEITELERENSYLTSKMLLATFGNDHTKETLKSSSLF